MTQKQYTIEKWSDWPHTIADAIRDFKGQYFKSPNILLANPHTLSQFDFLVNVMQGEKDNVQNSLNRFPSANTDVRLSSFVFSDCSVQFCLQHDLPDKCFILCQDDDDWDGDDPVVEWIPVDEGRAVLSF